MPTKFTLADFENLQKIEPPQNPLKVARTAKGYSQADVANALGLSVRQYQRYENGEKEIGSAHFQLGVNICEILGLEIFDVVSSIYDIYEDDTVLPGVYEESPK